MANERFDHDVIILGGGPAGLQAALTLGRVHRDVLLLDSGRYRNDPATHMHNVVTHDGRPPAEFRAAARADLAAYATVTVREAAATSVAPHGSGFRVEVDGDTVSGRGIVLATGLRDTMPDVPGLTDLFGTRVAHCPFCHGHEMAGQHVGVLGDSPAAEHVAGIMGPVAASVTLLPEQTVTAVEPAGAGVRVTFTDASTADFGSLFAKPEQSQAAPFADQLGLAMLPSGCVEIDVMGRTSLPGVHAAGDMAHLAALPMPMASVITAAASGQVAGAAMVAYLL